MKTRIKELCKLKGITISSIAEQIGTTQTSLSRALGENGNPTLETLEKIATALDVPITELFQISTNNELYGLVIYKGTTYQINSVEALERLYNAVHSDK